MMHRSNRVAMAAGSLFGRAAFGFALFMGILAIVSPPPEPDARARPGSADSPANSSTVTLRVPEGEISATLNVVDASGSQLAILTHVCTGDTILVAPRGGGAGSVLQFTGKGTAKLQMVGTARESYIEMDPDGTTRTSMRERFPGKVPRGG
jgi:hypothetical protein